MSEKHYAAVEKTPYGEYTSRSRVGTIGDIQEWMEGEGVALSDTFFFKLGQEVEVRLVVEDD